MNAKFKPAIVPVTVWTTLEFVVTLRFVSKPMKRLRPVRRHRHIPTQAAGCHRARRAGKVLRHGRWCW